MTALKKLSPRDVAILIGLALVASGLWFVYPPSAPIAVGAFLLWYTTMRKVEP